MTSLGGPFADRTALNATVTGTIERNGYRVEKVIFESQPKFFVTANLYVPTRGAGPFPAILFPLGHESGAKAHEAWQRVLANLAMRGFVLLAWDPIGQGERIQMWDEDFLTSKLVASTTEHTMQGIQTLLVGDALAEYDLRWDARTRLPALPPRGGPKSASRATPAAERHLLYRFTRRPAACGRALLLSDQLAPPAGNHWAAGR